MIRGDVIATPETRRQRRWMLPAALMTTGALTLTACSGSGASEKPMPCVSPLSAVGSGEGRPALKTVPRMEWPAVLAMVEVPEDATGVSAYWRFKGDKGWPYESVPIPREKASQVAFIVGDKSVEFAFRVLAEQGSAACTDLPEVAYAEPQARAPLAERGGVTFPEWLPTV